VRVLSAGRRGHSADGLRLTKNNSRRGCLGGETSTRVAGTGKTVGQWQVSTSFPLWSLSANACLILMSTRSRNLLLTDPRGAYLDLARLRRNDLAPQSAPQALLSTSMSPEIFERAPI
jgi:hypothetical protein